MHTYTWCQVPVSHVYRDVESSVVLIPLWSSSYVLQVGPGTTFNIKSKKIPVWSKSLSTSSPEPKGNFWWLVLIIDNFKKKLKNVSCEYDHVNGWNSTLQAAWYIRHVRIIWFLWTKRTIWLLILSFTQNIFRACSMFNPYERCRSVTQRQFYEGNSRRFWNETCHGVISCRMS